MSLPNALPTVSAERCSGGLLDSHADLSTIWLALRTEGQSTVAKNLLMRGQRPGTASSAPPPPLDTVVRDLRKKKAVFFVPTLRLPYLCELRRILSTRFGIELVAVSEPQCVLRSRDMIDVLSAPCYGSRWNALVQSFYTPLRADYARYNEAVLRALPRGELAATANLVRLTYVNRLLIALRRHASSLCEQRDAVRADSPMLSLPKPAPPLSPPPKLPVPPVPSPLFYGHSPSPGRLPSASSAASRSVRNTPSPNHPLRGSRTQHPKYCVVQADPVRDGSRTRMGPRDYIVAGVRVPAHLLNSVEIQLKRDYRLYIQVSQPGGARYSTAHPTLGSLASLANNGTAMLEVPPVCNVISPLLEPLPPAVAPPPSASSSGASTPTMSVTTIGAPPPLILGDARTARSRFGSPPGGFLGLASSARHLRDHQSVEEHLRSCFGVGWSSVCNAAIRNALRQQREQKLAAICAELAAVEEAKANAVSVRQSFIDRALQRDIASTGLEGYCAFKLVRESKEEELSALIEQLPFGARHTVVKARKRVALLNETTTSVDVYFA